MSQLMLTLAVRLLVVVAGLLSSVVTARYLGPEGRGWFYFWTTASMLVVQFGNLGLHASNTYLLARLGVNGGVLASNSLVGALLAGSVWTASGLAVASGLGHHEAWSPGVAVPMFVMSTAGLYFLLASNLLVALGRLGAYNALEVLNKGLSLVALLVAAILWSDPVLLLWALAIAAAMSALMLGLRLRQYVKSTLPRFAVFRQGFTYGLKAYLVACIAALVARLNAFLLEPQIPPADYGAWSIAAQIFDVLLLIPSSVALVLLPKVMRSNEPRRMVRVNAWAVAAAMALMSVVFLLVGRPLIVLLYGEAYEAAFGYVVWGLPGLVALSVTSVLSQYMATVGLPRMLIAMWVLVAALHAFVAVQLIPQYGAKGAMASLSVAYVACLLLMYGLIRTIKDKHA